ncbi:MAG: hypothetical protein QOJ21_3131 [Solirubrobacteraceae bacterium]|nr:hypothetical protein [Solirubrobacteraceae bacterium]
MSTASPARLYAMIAGVVLVAAGILGFFYEPAFSSDPSVRSPVLGILDTNGFHNVVHIATGVLGILAARTVSSARTYCLLFGSVYHVVAIWGFALGGDGSILSIIPVNTEDSVLHLILSAGGFAAYAASAPSTGRASARPAVG